MHHGINNRMNQTLNVVLLLVIVSVFVQWTFFSLTYSRGPGLLKVDL